MMKVYTKNMFGERIYLDCVFMQEIAKKNEVQYCHADILYEGKKYYIKNVPFSLLINLGTIGLKEYLIKIILEFDISDGIFDYEKFLLE